MKRPLRISPAPIFLSVVLSFAAMMLAPPAAVSALTWQSLGSGVVGTRVDHLYVWGDVLVVGGEFTTAGGISAHNIAVWDGTNWSTLGDGFDSFNHMTEYNGQLVVGGKRPLQAANGVWAWNGNGWVSLTPEFHYLLTGFQNYLYGTSTYTYGTVGQYTGTRLHRFDGTGWTIVQFFTGFLSDLYTPQTMKVLGGQLRLLMSYGGDVHSFSGTTWTALGGSEYWPSDVCLWNGAVVVTGKITVDAYTKKWNGSGWSNNFMAGWGEWCAHPTATTEYSGLLLVSGYYGGGFPPCYVPATGYRVLSYDGAAWAPVGDAMDDNILDLEIYNGTLIAAGLFNMTGNVATPLIARYAEAPVSVAISRLSARVVDAGVELTWDVAADETFDGFNVYRTSDGKMTHANTTMLSSAERSFIDRAVAPGHRYTYELVAIGTDSGEIRSAPVSIEIAPPATALHQNTPNPFNPSTTIRYVVGAPGRVSIVVYATDGRRIRTLVDEVRPAGRGMVTWDGKDGSGNDVAAGLYFYRLQTGKTSLARKMVLIK